MYANQLAYNIKGLKKLLSFAYKFAGLQPYPYASNTYNTFRGKILNI